MSTAALHIHDVGLRVALDSEIGASPPPSPGFALLDGDEVEIGLAAARRSRLKPRHIHNRFWDQLGTAALERPFPRALSTADLAFAHLTSVWEPFRGRATESFVVVPAWYDQQQLGLLLSLARAAQLPVACLLDGAVAACASLAEMDPTSTTSAVLHLDLYLHRAVAERLTPSPPGRQLALREDVGLVGILDTVAKEAAEVFVRRTRFDPLHGATSEQRLYDLLPGWLERLRTVETVVASLASGGAEHVVELTRDALLPRLEPVYRRLSELAAELVREDDVVVVSHRLAALPGFEQRLEQVLSRRPISLPPGAAVAGALAARRQIEAAQRRHADAEAVPLVTSLFLDESEASEDRSAAPAAAPALVEASEPSRMALAPDRGCPPTHLLYGGRARRITEDPLKVGSGAPAGQDGHESGGRTVVVGGAEVAPHHCTLVRRDGRVLLENHSPRGSLLNGRPVVGQIECRAGDRLRLGTAGAELELIEVDDG